MRVEILKAAKKKALSAYDLKPGTKFRYGSTWYIRTNQGFINLETGGFQFINEVPYVDEVAELGDTLNLHL